MYVPGNIYEKLARQNESESDYKKAAYYWRMTNRLADAEACEMIAQAIDKGDAYRQEVDEKIGECPELTPDTIRQYQQWHKDLREIYFKHFPMPKNTDPKGE
jgi:TPR repeat protein